MIDCHALLGKGMTWADPAGPVEYDVAEPFERGAAAGITRHCVMAPRGDDYAGANRRIAEACRKHAGRLTGIAVHNPHREAGRLRETLTREVREMGLRGVRSDGHPTRELLDAVRELRIPVIYYPDRGRGQGLGRFFHMPASAYPDVAVLVPHLGEYRSLTWQVHLEALDLARRYRNIYLETSGLGSFKYLEMAAKELPAEQLVFGTQAPELAPRVEREALRLLKLNRQAHAKVAGANAVRIGF